MKLPKQSSGCRQSPSLSSAYHQVGVIPAQGFPNPFDPFGFNDPCSAYAESIGVDPNVFCGGPNAGGGPQGPSPVPGNSGGSNAGSLDCAFCSAQYFACFAECASFGILQPVCEAFKCRPQLQKCANVNGCN